MVIWKSLRVDGIGILPGERVSGPVMDQFACRKGGVWEDCPWESQPLCGRELPPAGGRRKLVEERRLRGMKVAPRNAGLFQALSSGQKSSAIICSYDQGQAGGKVAS